MTSAWGPKRTETPDLDNLPEELFVCFPVNGHALNEDISQTDQAEDYCVPARNPRLGKPRGSYNIGTDIERKFHALVTLFNTEPDSWLPGKNEPKLKRLWYSCARENRHSALFRAALSLSPNMRSAYAR